MPDRRAHRMLQLLRGVFPCAMWSKWIGRSLTDECPLCHKRETPSHILCWCKELREIITALHDKIWGHMFEYLRSHLSNKWNMWYNGAIGRMGVALHYPLPSS
eukprot:2705220-Rhodomonas_salina.1